VDLSPIFENATASLGAGMYALVAVLAFSEMVAGLGLLSPGETVLFVAGGAAANGDLHLGLLVAVAWAAGVAGDHAGYALGRRRGRALLGGRNKDAVAASARTDRLERVLARWGPLALIGGRFFGPVRAFGPFLAGTSGMPRRRFGPASVIGAGLWTTTFIVAGYGLAGPVAGLISTIGSAIFAALVIATLAWACRRIVRGSGQAAVVEATAGTSEPL
jgi:membrane-associated protein